MSRKALLNRFPRPAWSSFDWGWLERFSRARGLTWLWDADRLRLARLDIVPGRAFVAGFIGGEAEAERRDRDSLSGGVGGAGWM